MIINHAINCLLVLLSIAFEAFMQLSAWTLTRTQMEPLMTSISPTQRAILKAAAKTPLEDIRQHMQELKSPVIREKVYSR